MVGVISLLDVLSIFVVVFKLFFFSFRLASCSCFWSFILGGRDCFCCFERVFCVSFFCLALFFMVLFRVVLVFLIYW